MNSREAAFCALLQSLKGEGYISDYLEQWFSKENPSLQDYHLAQQIAYGSAQMALGLDWLAMQASEKKKLQLKVKERALLRTAVYQLYFLDRIPNYAVLNETLILAKKYFHRYFVNYLNAILRKLSEAQFSLPQGMDISSLSIRYSYPESFVSLLFDCYGQARTLEILETGNQPALLMARRRGQTVPMLDQKIVMDDPFKVVEIPMDSLKNISRSVDYYIQNATPAYLIGYLCKHLKIAPQRILDVCASPGGKSIAVHDFFPDAELYANDQTDFKLLKLKENFEKYDIKATLTCCPGQELHFNEKFDVIILDVPCSNSGVLNKRPEARWRLTDENYVQLEKVQISLLEQAIRLLKPLGEIWYMTCSILPKENEELVAKVDLKVQNSHLILPNEQGWDGGFACSLSF
jgi:16S rRNA (cytosine967-C5)-methyltransferase